MKNKIEWLYPMNRTTFEEHLKRAKQREKKEYIHFQHKIKQYYGESSPVNRLSNIDCYSFFLEIAWLQKNVLYGGLLDNYKTNYKELKNLCNFTFNLNIWR